MKAPQAKVLVGTSGWSYAHWKGVFYPPELRPKELLAFYASEFPTVEVNSSFYHMPCETTLEHWASATPDNFRFALKLNRYITHRLRLRQCREPLETFLRLALILGTKLGPLLVQLPPGLKRDLILLQDFLDLLPPDILAAIEFRHTSWYEEETFKLLSAKKRALCVHDLQGSEAPLLATAQFVYVRLHGPQRGYTGSYTQEQLAHWATTISAWLAAGKDVWVYFNNDIGGHAVHNARELRSLLERPILEAEGRYNP